MLMEWNEAKMGTGVKTIDDQHQEIFRMINGLHETMTKGKGVEELPKMMEFLKNYVVKHFGHEEGVMAAKKCACAEANKKAHAEFLAEFTKLYDQYKKAGASTVILLQIQRMCATWLLQHIGRIDTQLKTCGS